jgi:hypothetical protein
MKDQRIMTPVFSSFRAQLYKTNKPENKKIRVGLMINDPKLIAVFAEIVKDLRAADFIDVCLVVTRKPAPVKTKSTLERVWGLRRHLLSTKLREKIAFHLYSILDNRRNREIAFFDEVSIEEHIGDVPRYEVEPFEKGFSDYFSDQDVKFVKQHELDVLLRFGFRILRGDILNAAKCGVWSYHHGDQDFYRGSPPYFWEMVEDAPLAGVILQILNERLDDGRVLVKGRFANQKSLSVKRNKLVPYLGAQHFVIDQLRRLHSVGWESYSALLEAPQPFQGKRKIYRSPTNIEMASWVGSFGLEKLTNRFKKRDLIRHWRIGIRKRDDNFMQRLAGGLIKEDYQWLESPKGHFWADPMLCDVDGKTFLFFEDYSYQAKRAVIACAEITSDMKLGNVRTVLDTGTHASFPLVFTEGNDVFMVPETREDGTVSLYKAVAFPDKWEKVKVLVNLPCVDSIVWKQDGIWWLHTSYNFNHGHAHTALLYSSATLMGDWELHQAAPFAPDARYARNGGPVLSAADGKRYRVSQSSEFSYGSSFSFHEIKQLDQTQYREAHVLKVQTAQESTQRGTHSFCLSKHFEVVDGVWNESSVDVI